MRDGWTSTGRLQRQFLGGEIDTTLPPDERERADELADFAKMTEIRARVDRVVTDPAVAELLKPWYRYMCKRPAFSDLDLQTFNRPDVTLLDTSDHGGITRMTGRSVLVGDRAYEVDRHLRHRLRGRRLGRVLRNPAGVRPRRPDPARGVVTGTPDAARLLQQRIPQPHPPRLVPGRQLRQHGPRAPGEGDPHRRRPCRGPRPRRSTGRTSAAAEAAWAGEIAATAHDTFAFVSECTPGYYNGEGRPRRLNMSYGPGPVAFHRLLRDWRHHHLDDVLSFPRT